MWVWLVDLPVDGVEGISNRTKMGRDEVRRTSASLSTINSVHFPIVPQCAPHYSTKGGPSGGGARYTALSLTDSKPPIYPALPILIRVTRIFVKIGQSS
jgi:hypothetical protein